MPLASPFDFGNVARNRVKVYGGNVVQCPADQGGPGNPYTFYWHYQHWGQVFPCWIMPQLRAWKRLGANTIRVQGGQNGVWMGLYTQAEYEACLRELLAACRGLGLWLDQCQMGVRNYSDILKPDGSQPAEAEYQDGLRSVFAHVYEADRDAILCIEAGNQESANADPSFSARMCRFARGITTMPLLISNLSFECPEDYLHTDADVIGAHLYPEGWGYGRDAETLSGKLFAALSTNKPPRPVLLEECGIFAGVGQGGRYADKADFIAALFEACFPHPDCAGVLWWGGYGNATDPNGASGISGDWTLWQPPPGAGSDGRTDYDPTLVWADTVASRRFASFGPRNRNLRWAMRLSGAQPITSGTPPALPFDRPLATRFYGPTAVRAAGTLTAACDAPVTLRLAVKDAATMAVTAVGDPVTLFPGAMAQAPFALAGTVQPNPNGSVLTLTARAASGAGVLSLLDATLTVGSAPGLQASPPASLRVALSAPLAPRASIAGRAFGRG